MEHVFDGEVRTHVNNAGKLFKRGVGGHYLKSQNIRVSEVLGKADKNGVLKARIQVRDLETGKWINKQQPSTFYPDHWSRRQVKHEVKEAFYNSKPLSKYMWQGRSPSGIDIQGYYNPKIPNGSASTAWPVYQGK
jgi:hypothetical protein